MLNFVCLRSKSLLVNYIARYGIIYGRLDSFMGRNILNCSSRYKISLDNIFNLHFQPSDSCIRANVGISVLLSPSIELLQGRDGSSNSSSNDFNIADISSMNNSSYIALANNFMILDLRHSVYCTC